MVDADIADVESNKGKSWPRTNAEM